MDVIEVPRSMLNRIRFNIDRTRQVNGVVQMVSAGVASFEDVINLGLVFKASAIQETVFVLFEVNGIPLTAALPASAELA